MQAITGALGARVRPAGVVLVAAIAFGLMCAESAAASTAYSAVSAKPHPIPWTGWNGRPIQRPHKPVGHALLKRALFPAGWSAGAVRYGTGYHRLNGSERVREVQRRLTRLGYHTGPIDGLFGPLTRSSVQWFQIKHGLRPTGVVAATTLATLRHPKGFAQQLKAQAKRPRVPGGQPGVRPTAIPEPQSARPVQHDAPAWLVPALIAAFAVVLGALVLTLLRSARRAPAARRPKPAVSPSPAAAAPRAAVSSPEPGLPVLGYVTGESEPGSEEHENAIRDACRSRGWTLARLVRDARAGTGQPFGRPGLSYALDQLTEGAASRLVVHKLEHVARSLGELRLVLGWFMRTGIALTALDVGLDTSTPEGRAAALTLVSVSRSEQARVAAKTSNGLAAARAASRPAVEDSPELAGRIRKMRASGMTLQAIADTLNREGVPTVRGGSEWRPSSVQCVLGYRRTGTPNW
jgi:DNA invertase Pin-like site-specific DNA recombinase